ncbi:hypothetical protein HDU87_002178 [Geranomyces variabilis]|uniref:Uncharacterized protein n=1 Tax=Geranomyces variabilis TaxID=109894 RepID=A0AAD5TND4_9FUNG|nr:hypothetical protein HDU87_002178 [Geranomyces variabilis]
MDRNIPSRLLTVRVLVHLSHIASAITFHRRVLTRDVALNLQRLGAKVPRFLVQQVVKEQAEAVLNLRPGLLPFSPGLYAFFIAEGYRLYGEEAELSGDDSSTLASAMFDDNSLPQIRRLIMDFDFVPLRSLILNPEAVVFRLSKTDMKFIDHLLANGWVPEEVNEGVMLRVMTSAVTACMLSEYLDRGFILTPRAIKAALRKCDEPTLDTLRSHVPAATLQDMVHAVFVDNLAPDFNFSITLVTFLQHHFEIPEHVVEFALIGQRTDGPTAGAGSYCSVDDGLLIAQWAEAPFADLQEPTSAPLFQQTRSQPPRTLPLPASALALPVSITRCSKQPKPGVAWRWVLQTYGPHHRFAQWCFDDSLLRMSHMDGGARPSAYDFLAAGARFRPRHARYLSAIAIGCSGFAVLAAHDLLHRMRVQVVGSGSDAAASDDTHVSILGGRHHRGSIVSVVMKHDPADPAPRADETSSAAALPAEKHLWCSAFQAEVQRLQSPVPATLPAPATALVRRNDDPFAKTNPDAHPPVAPVWAHRKPSDPSFPAAWFLREMESILGELKSSFH